MKSRVTSLLSISLLFSLLLSGSAFAESTSPNIVSKALSSEEPLSDEIPIKTEQETDKQKSKRAELLSQWVIQQMEANHAQVGVISRIGSNLAVLFDKTGMTHSGFVFRHPETHEWITYSLYSDPTKNYKKSKVWQQNVKGFYYGQSGSKTDTLLSIPGQEIQDKLYQHLTTQPFKLLLPSDEHYSLVAPIESPTSFNCTKWVLLQYFSAKYNSDDTADIIQKMNHDYSVSVEKPGLLVRYILKRKPDVDWTELAPPNHVHTATVTSMYKSSLFEKKVFYHDTKRF
jgi:hypothetical protein